MGTRNPYHKREREKKSNESSVRNMVNKIIVERKIKSVISVINGIKLDNKSNIWVVKYYAITEDYPDGIGCIDRIRLYDVAERLHSVLKNTKDFGLFKIKAQHNNSKENYAD